MREITKFFLPTALIFFFKKIVGNVLSFKLHNKVNENIKLKNIHKGKRCFILATGPSINNQNLTSLANEICISVGQFYNHKDALTIKPSYHIEAPMHEPFAEDYIKKFSDKISLIYTHDVNIFLGVNQYKHSFHKHENLFFDLFKYNYINYFFNNHLDDISSKFESMWNLTGTPFAPRTVIYSAIQLAAYMGFKEIYLLGCDHDYLLRYFNNTLDGQHFYNEKLSTFGSADSQNSKDFNLEMWFEEYFWRWKQYRLMDEYLRKKNQFIFNATEKSMLDVFEKVDFKKL
jgi:hypothetical protein